MQLCDFIEELREIQDYYGDCIDIVVDMPHCSFGRLCDPVVKLKEDEDGQFLHITGKYI